MTDVAATKPVAHPAKYNDDILDAMRSVLHEVLPSPAGAEHLGVHTILDPFAGVGRIHQLADEYMTFGIELEPEWAEQDHRTTQGNALHLPYADEIMDAIATSPCYGNRMGDHHNAIEKCQSCSGTGLVVGDNITYVAGETTSFKFACSKCDGVGRRVYKRNTYTHTLGRPLSLDNAGAMQWGPTYRSFHLKAWREACRVLRPGGYFLLNIKDHIRGGHRQLVAGFHVHALEVVGGLKVVDILPIPAKGNQQGANRELRVEAELLVTMRKPMG